MSWLSSLGLEFLLFGLCCRGVEVFADLWIYSSVQDVTIFCGTIRTHWNGLLFSPFTSLFQHTAGTGLWASKTSHIHSEMYRNTCMCCASSPSQMNVEFICFRAGSWFSAVCTDPLPFPLPYSPLHADENRLPGPCHPEHRHLAHEILLIFAMQKAQIS